MFSLKPPNYNNFLHIPSDKNTDSAKEEEELDKKNELSISQFQVEHFSSGQCWCFPSDMILYL